MTESLYEIASLYRQIADMEPETDEERAAMIQALDEVEDQFESKLENCIYFLRNTESRAEAIKAEEARLADKRKKLERKAESFRNYIEAMMMLAQRREAKAGIFDVKFKLNPESVTIHDLAAVPDEFFITERRVSPALLQKAHRENREQMIPGVEFVRNERMVIG